MPSSSRTTSSLRKVTSTPSLAMRAQPFFCTEVRETCMLSRAAVSREGKETFSIVYTLAGDGTIATKAGSARLPKGMALLLDCRSKQRLETGEGAEGWRFVEARVDGTGMCLACALLGCPDLAPVPVAQSQALPQFETIFSRLGEEDCEGVVLICQAVQALLAKMALAALRDSPAPEDGPVSLACAYVEDHYAEAVSVGDMARAASVSAGYLTRLFRARLETTPHDYLMRYRISRAKELLADTDLSLAAIADLTGFASESHLSARFKRTTGQSPRTYRKSMAG